MCFCWWFHWPNLTLLGKGLGAERGRRGRRLTNAPLVEMWYVAVDLFHFLERWTPQPCIFFLTFFRYSNFDSHFQIFQILFTQLLAKPQISLVKILHRTSFHLLFTMVDVQAFTSKVGPKSVSSLAGSSDSSRHGRDGQGEGQRQQIDRSRLRISPRFCDFFRGWQVIAMGTLRFFGLEICSCFWQRTCDV